MPAAFKARITQIWTKLAQDHKWGLIKDQEAFLTQAANRIMAGYLSKTSLAEIPDKWIRSSLIGIYSEQIYLQLKKQDQQAAHELWQTCIQLSLRRGFTLEDAEDLAQDTIVKLFASLANIQNPRSIIQYTFMILIRLLNERRKKKSNRDKSYQEGSESLSQAEDFEAVATDAQVKDSVVDYFPESVELIIQKETRTKAIHLFKQLLRNPLELEVMLLVMEGYAPREIAEKLSLIPQRVRLAKHRAIQKLKNDSEFMTFMSSLQ